MLLQLHSKLKIIISIDLTCLIIWETIYTVCKLNTWQTWLVLNSLIPVILLQVKRVYSLWRVVINHTQWTFQVVTVAVHTSQKGIFLASKCLLYLIICFLSCGHGVTFHCVWLTVLTWQYRCWYSIVERRSNIWGLRRVLYWNAGWFRFKSICL